MCIILQESLLHACTITIDFYRVDSCFVIKVADFGLSENMDISKDYFRQTEDSINKLPLRWLALESITDRKFSEKTDVVWTYRRVI